MILFALLIGLSFFAKAGMAGQFFLEKAKLLVGDTVFPIPFILLFGGVVLLKSKHNFIAVSSQKKILWPVMLAVLMIISGITGILGAFEPLLKRGGLAGYFISWPFLKYFGFWATLIIFSAPIIIGFLIFWQFIKKSGAEEETLPAAGGGEEKEKKPSIIRKFFAPKFEVKEVPPFSQPENKQNEKQPAPAKMEQRPAIGAKLSAYQPPPLDLLEKEHGVPTSGDTRINSAIIKKTFQNFGIEVAMSEVNIGPTVTQYTLKPAEGVKLSKITSLSNDLALALASHPIRIEAPIPGRALVGIEMPNKVRAQVRLRNLIENQDFQKSSANLLIALGRDVSGATFFSDLTRMPHMLVAGSTGSGKTCAADTLMFTERGMLTFEELCPLPLNNETDFKLKLVTRDGIETTSKNYNNGICEFYKLSTSRGYQVKATAEHPLWIINEDGSQGWKPASLIKKGDYVAISRGPGLFGNKINLSDFKPSKIKSYHRKISFPFKLTPQLAQFLGLLTADGGLSVERKGLHRIVYTQANSCLIRLYKESLKELFGIIRFIEKKSGSNPNNKAKDIEVNSKHLKEFLAYLGIGSWRSPQKEMPRAIREAPKEIVTVYLRALFDNDGYVGKNSIEFCISSKKLAHQIHIMLLNFGIVSSLAIKKVKNYEHNDYYRISIFGQEARKFIREIGFIRKEKYNKVRQFLKLSPNPNVDLIPHIASLLRRMGQKYLNRFACLTNQGWKYQGGILVPKYAFSSLRTYNSGFRVPGYQAIEKILDFYQPISQEPEYQELEKIWKRNFYWDKIKKIERTSGVGYDFYVPGSDSFVGNGFVNHNTIFLNSLILSLLYQPNNYPRSSGPEFLRFILVDPKRVEFPVYNNLPHLLCPVIYNATQTLNALRWLTGEMERRFDVLAGTKARDIKSFNEQALKNNTEPLPFIIVVIDELADLMAARGREIEAAIVRLAQMARAVGIHLVVATQRPSVEVITGLIKANIISRVTFQVASQVDSRTILDTSGAEKLLGAGDLLYISGDVTKPKRIQGAYVSDKEVRKIINYITSQKEKEAAWSAEMDSGLVQALENGGEEAGVSFSSGFSSGEEDPLFAEAKRLVVEAKKASASLLQRRLRIGYARAARLIDMLEESGVVGPAEGAKPREVYSVQESSQSIPVENADAEGEKWEKI